MTTTNDERDALREEVARVAPDLYRISGDAWWKCTHGSGPSECDICPNRLLPILDRLTADAYARGRREALEWAAERLREAEDPVAAAYVRALGSERP